MWKISNNLILCFSAYDASLLAVINVTNVTTQDWEDIACGPCAVGTGHCIYIADSGRNAGPPSDTIFMLREPAINPASMAGGELNETTVAELKFK